MFTSSLRRTVIRDLPRIKISSSSSYQQRCAIASLPSSSSTATPYKHDDDTKKQQQQQQQQQYERRYVHSTVRTEADATVTATMETPVTVVKKSKVETTLTDRFVTTFEVTVSKIFAAGFCWQASSIVAGNQGFASDSVNFALTTGFGDALGVLGGHCLYYGTKKMIQGSSSTIDMTKELHTGILLGTAAMCSGTAWQPIVNVLQGANLPFSQVFIGTWIGCGTAFYIGMRVGRTILSGPLEHVHEPTYENGKNDIGLSIAIGGATGFFVGTDAAYLPEQNFLISIVGIQPGISDVTGCAIAGSSTGMGFLAAQSTMNMAFPAGKCWVD
jgi:hypothetical protein